jgi:hypothetical protein
VKSKAERYRDEAARRKAGFSESVCMSKDLKIDRHANIKRCWCKENAKLNEVYVRKVGRVQVG